MGFRSWIILLSVLSVGISVGRLTPPADAATLSKKAPESKAANPKKDAAAQPAAIAASPQAQKGDVQAAADAIDRFIAAQWKTAKAVPSPSATDAEYLRRVSLHIAGVIPPASRVRDFLADSSPDKRQRYIEKLLDGPEYVVNFSRLWRQAMLPGSDSDNQTRFLTPGFEGWLRRELSSNAPYDKMVRDTLMSDTNIDYRRGVQRNSPAAFAQSKQGAPENMGAAAARIFLGVRLECAQCHDHPFDDWKQEQFWSFAAFFSPGKELAIPKTKKVVMARFLDGTKLPEAELSSKRQRIAEWITSRRNPYFARAAANRIWAHLLGVGIVQPIDDFSGANPPSHRELLDYLADQLVTHDFDVKFLVRAIVASKTYQLSSRQTDPSQANPRLFACKSLERLSAAELYDSLAQATGVRVQFLPGQAFRFGNRSERDDINESFADSDNSSTERATTVLQALEVMNGKFVSQQTDLSNSQTLAAVNDAPFLKTDDKIEALYLTALGRAPTENELKRHREYVESDANKQKPDKALADIFWALLNSSEFLLNH